MVQYVTPDAFKLAVSIPDNATDDDVDRALDAASRAVEKATNRVRFDVDDTDKTRKFTATGPGLCFIDDIAAITAVDSAGTEVTAYTALPLNAIDDGEPYTYLKSAGLFATGEGEIEVTGRFGWPAVPEQVVQFVLIIASKLLKRSREAPWGVVTTGGIEGTAIRLAREDPDLGLLIGPLMKRYPVVL